MPKVISIYNVERPHASIDFLTPAQAHEQNGAIKKRWKTYLSKSTNINKVQNENQNEK